MKEIRRFRGKIIKRTVKVGDKIKIVYQSAEKGKPGAQEEVTLQTYLREVRKS